MSDAISGTIERYHQGTITREEMIHTLASRVYPDPQTARNAPTDATDREAVWRDTIATPEDGTAQEISQALLHGRITQADYEDWWSEWHRLHPS